MKTTLFSLLLLAAVSIANAAEPVTRSVADSADASGKAQLTVEEAKDALLRFIRANRGTFIGDPDPDKLAAAPAKALGNGRFSLGAFTLDLSKHTYSAEIGIHGPEPHFYNGTFVERNGVWIATEPNLQRAHGMPAK